MRTQCPLAFGLVLSALVCGGAAAQQPTALPDVNVTAPRRRAGEPEGASAAAATGRVTPNKQADEASAESVSDSVPATSAPDVSQG